MRTYSTLPPPLSMHYLMNLAISSGRAKKRSDDRLQKDLRDNVKSRILSDVPALRLRGHIHFHLNESETHSRFFEFGSQEAKTQLLCAKGNRAGLEDSL